MNCSTNVSVCVVLSSTDSCRYIHIYIYWIHTDTMINRRNDKDAGRLLRKIFTSHFIARVRKGLLKVCVRGSWRPNITEIFWPRSYGRQCCVFLVLHGCSTGALESTLLGAGFPYYISSISVSNSTQLNCPPSVQFIGLILPSNSHVVIWTCLHASAISSNIWQSGCVTSTIFGMAYVIVIECK